MLHGASDSTEGDRAFAGAAYVIARREGLDDTAKLILNGTIKVDEVPRSALPNKDAEGMYEPEASAGGFKGDTLYLPSDMRFSSLIAQGTVVHELTHAVQEADAKELRTPTVEDAELEAFTAEAGFYLSAVFRRSGAERGHAVEEIAKEISPPSLLGMLLVATQALNDDKAVAVVREVQAKVQEVGDLDARLALSTTDLERFIAGLQDEERHDTFTNALEKRARLGSTSSTAGSPRPGSAATSARVGWNARRRRSGGRGTLSAAPARVPGTGCAFC